VAAVDSFAHSLGMTQIMVLEAWDPKKACGGVIPYFPRQYSLVGGFYIFLIFYNIWDNPSH